MSEWGERRHKSPNDASVILCDLVAERENSSQQENMQKRAVLSGRLSFVHTVYPIFKVHSSDFFSNIFFLSMFARFARVGKKFQCSLPPFACLSMFRLPKPYCALRSQHLLSQMHSLSIIPELYSGTFPQKALLLRFPFPCTYPIPLGLKTKEEPRMNQGTPKELPTTQKCFLLRF